MYYIYLIDISTKEVRTYIVILLPLYICPIKSYYLGTTPTS